MLRIAFYLAFGSVAMSLVSIAVCQILLGAAFLALLLSGESVRLPRSILPSLSAFVLLTLLAVALSPDPLAGLPQVKKLFVFLMLPVAFTAITRLEHIRALVWCWAAAASASGLWAFLQFWTTRQGAIDQKADVYTAYVADRATGFMGHWMTFGAAQMAALLLLAALMIWAPPRRYRWLLGMAAVIISGSIVIGWTRSVWLAAAMSSIYLIAAWRPKLLFLAPVILGIGWFASPRSVRERAISIYQPHGDVDSNRHRYVTARTGLEMIRAHPWIGLGPEMPGKRFKDYVPVDISGPLPEGYYGHLHNLYLQYAAERGIPALVVFLWLIATVFRDWWRGLGSALLSSKAVLHGCIAVVLAFLIEGFFEYNLGDSEVLTMFWAVLAFGYRALEAEA
jgi:putative inorganic carbon (hco3(-)) transporter